MVNWNKDREDKETWYNTSVTSSRAFIFANIVPHLVEARLPVTRISANTGCGILYGVEDGTLYRGGLESASLSHKPGGRDEPS